MPKTVDGHEPIPQAVLDARFAERLPLAFGLLGLLYLFYAVGHWILLPPSVRAFMLPLALGTAGIFFLTAWCVRRGSLPAFWAHPIGCAAAGLIATNILAHVVLTRAPVELVGLMVLMIGMGSLFLSLGWYVFSCALLLAAALGASLAAGFSSENSTVAFSVMAAAFVGGATQHFQVRSTRHYEATLRAQAEVEQELRKSRAGYRLLVDHARDLIVSFDAEGRFTYLSPSFEAMLGREEKEFLGQHVTDAKITGELAEELGRYLAQMQRGDRDQMVFEAPLVSGSGDIVWCEILAGAVPSADGGLEGVHVVARDVSQRRAAEEELRLAQFSVDQAGDSILRVSSRGDVLFANETALEITGYPRDEITGMHFAGLFPGEDTQDWKAFWQRLRENEVVRFESSQHNAIGETTPAELVVKLIEYQGREQAFAFVRDVSERKKAEQALRSAKEAAERAVDSKSKFLATMSHELRTPLNGVIGISDLLNDGALTGEQREQVDLLRVSGEALLRIIDNLLDFSKIEASMLELEEADFEPGKLLEEVAELFAATAQRENLEVICDVGAELPARVQGDAARLRQILSNLASNAVKFTTEGEIVLRVRRVRSDAAGAWLRFQVLDSGVGIPPEAQERIFSSFVQANPATNREFGGSGLGLAVCRELASLMGGELTVASQVGSGSCFQLEVPLAEVASLPSQAAPPLPSGPVLLLEGNDRQREVLTERLECWGIEVCAAADAPAARAQLERAADRGQPFAYAFLAISALDHSSLEIGRAIQTSPQHSQTERIWLTRSLTEGLREILQAEGGVSIAKPIRTRRLAECLGAPAVYEDHESSFASRSPSSKRLRLLVAEDNAVNRKLVEAMLDRLGMDYDLVADGATAVEAVRDNRYDGVLMDCQMPGMDGFEATRQIRVLDAQRGQHTPILAVTASAMAGDRAHCLEAGMDGHIAKPLRFEALASALSPWMEAPVAIDETELMRRVEDDRALAGELARIFLDQLPEQLGEIQRQLSAGDAEALARAAHALVSSASHFGDGPVSECAQELEQLGRDGRTDNGQEIFRRLLRALRDLRPGLRTISTGASA